MFEKIKPKVNKKYAIISVYVIITAIIILILARATIQIENICGVVIGALKYIGRVLIPVFIGVIIAYIVNPMVVIVDKMYRKIRFFKPKNEKKYRSRAVFSCMIFIILLIFMILGAFIFSITRQFSNIGIDKIINIVSGYINGFSDSLKNIEGKLSDFNIESKAIDQYAAQFSTTLTSLLTDFTNNLVANTMNISGSISNFIFGIIIAIYLLLDKDDFVQYENKFLKAMFSERTEKKIKCYFQDFDYILSGYIRGTVIDALFLCVVLSIILPIIGIKFGVLIGIFAGLCHLIPYFGPIAAFAGTLIFGLLNGQYSQVVVAIIVLIIVQQIDVNIVQPKLIGNRVSLKPVFILISIIVGAEVDGILGMVLAVPVAAIIRLLLKRSIEERLKKKELLVRKKNINVDNEEI